MAVNTNIYDEKFFKNTLKLEEPSAKAAVQIINNRFKPKSIIDIGCGIGIYLKEFEYLGVEITGFDGAPEAVKNSLVGDKIKLHDLSRPLRLDSKFDLCLCVEVAEHLPKAYEDTLLNTLIRLSNTIIFSAATPGQGDESIGHINEQPHEYWINKFHGLGFAYQKYLTDDIRAEMAEKKVVWWIAKNIMVFKKT